MPDAVAASTPSLPEAIHPPAISLREIWPWAVLGLALLAVLYVVGAEEGATSLTSGTLIHEFVHDGRHLLGFPCH
jgi:Probable cobalt transporter subunit (CbtB)